MYHQCGKLELGLNVSYSGSKNGRVCSLWVIFSLLKDEEKNYIAFTLVSFAEF